MRRALAPVPASGGKAQGALSGKTGLLWADVGSRPGGMALFVPSKLLARLLSLGLLGSAPRPLPLTKFTARLRKFSPVAARLFLLKSSALGMVGMVACPRDTGAISNGEEGDGGLLDREVTEDLFMARF